MITIICATKAQIVAVPYGAGQRVYRIPSLSRPSGIAIAGLVTAASITHTGSLSAYRIHLPQLPSGIDRRFVGLGWPNDKSVRDFAWITIPFCPTKSVPLPPYRTVRSGGNSCWPNPIPPPPPPPFFLVLFSFLLFPQPMHARAHKLKARSHKITRREKEKKERQISHREQI